MGIAGGEVLTLDQERNAILVTPIHRVADSGPAFRNILMGPGGVWRYMMCVLESQQVSSTMDNPRVVLVAT